MKKGIGGLTQIHPFPRVCKLLLCREVYKCRVYNREIYNKYN